jgi:hypothetical protein
MERCWNDPERGKRGIPERKHVLFCTIYKGSVRTSHRTLISIRKNKRQMLHVKTIAVFVRNTQNTLPVDKTDIFVLNLDVCRPTATTRLYFNHVRLIFV